MAPRDSGSKNLALRLFGQCLNFSKGCLASTDDHSRRGLLPLLPSPSCLPAASPINKRWLWQPPRLLNHERPSSYGPFFAVDLTI